MKLDPETLEHLVEEGLITFDQAEMVRLKNQTLVNPHLIPSIRARTNEVVMAKQRLVEDPEQESLTAEVLDVLKKNDDEVVVIILDIIRRLLVPVEDSEKGYPLISDERSELLTRIVTALLPVIMSEGTNATIELGSQTMNRLLLQRGIAQTGVVTPEMHDTVVAWVQSLTKKQEFPADSIDDKSVQFIEVDDSLGDLEDFAARIQKSVARETNIPS